MQLTVEKIGGTSMSDYVAVRDNIVLGQGARRTHRIIVVSAYAGITDLLLEHKKTGQPGVYGFFASGEENETWQNAMADVRARMLEINRGLFGESGLREQADHFITARLATACQCLEDLKRLCTHGHFALDAHLLTIRELLASLGEAHSAWNMSAALGRDGIAAQLLDLTGWQDTQTLELNEQIARQLGLVTPEHGIVVATGYCRCAEGLMASFDRGYSEMTFSGLAVQVGAVEALIHKEYHLSSADPKIVGPERVVPIGRTNYDVADQLANLGMEAIHPKAANGLRQKGIPLRVKNTFEPEHNGTLITQDYISEKPCVEIIAGRRNVYAISVFDQDMVGDFYTYEDGLSSLCKEFKATVITKDVNANTITYYVGTNIKNAKRVESRLADRFPSSTVSVRKVAIVSAIGSDLQVPGILAEAVNALAQASIGILALHQCMRQVDIQFVVDEKDFDVAITRLHESLIEIHKHRVAICAA